MKGRWLPAVRALLVLAVAAAAVIVANFALLGVAVGGNEPVGKLRPRVALTASVPEPPATTDSLTEPGAPGDDEPGEGAETADD